MTERTPHILKLAEGYALFSANDEYRYVLGRHVSGVELGRPTLRFIMLNPSKANATKDDATIRRCKGFAQRWGYLKIEVLNLFARVSTDPKALHAGDPVGYATDKRLEDAFVNAQSYGGEIVVAWGSFQHDLMAERVGVITKLALRYEQKLLCLGKTLSGSPRHPLRLSYDTKLEAWP